MIHDSWLEVHSYLRPIADLAEQVERAAAGIEVFDVHIPDWDNYREEFLAGVPLLTSIGANIDLEPGERMAAALLERLGTVASSEPLPGLLRYVGWIGMAVYLRPVVTAFDSWRDDDRASQCSSSNKRIKIAVPAASLL